MSPSSREIDEEPLYFGSFDSGLVSNTAIQQVEEPVRRILAFKYSNLSSLAEEYFRLVETAKLLHVRGDSLIPTDPPKLTQAQINELSSSLSAIEERRGLLPTQKALLHRLFSWLGGTTVTTSALVDMVSLYLKTLGWANPDSDSSTLRNVSWKTAMSVVDRLCYREDLLRSCPNGGEFLYFEFKDHNFDKKATDRKAWAGFLESMGLFLKELKRLESDPPPPGSAMTRLRRLDEAERKYVLDRKVIDTDAEDLTLLNETLLGKRQPDHVQSTAVTRESQQHHIVSLFNLLPGSLQRPQLPNTPSTSRWSLLPSTLTQVDIRDPFGASIQNPGPQTPPSTKHLFASLLGHLHKTPPNSTRTTRITTTTLTSQGPLYKALRFDRLLKMSKKKVKSAKTGALIRKHVFVAPLLAELFESVIVVKNVPAVWALKHNLEAAEEGNLQSGRQSRQKGPIRLDQVPKTVPCALKMFRLRKDHSFVISGSSFIQLEEFSGVSFSYCGSVLSPALADRKICSVQYEFKRMMESNEPEAPTIENETPEANEESLEPAESLKTKSQKSTESELESEEEKDFDAKAAEYGLKPGQGFVVFDDHLSDNEFLEDVDLKERERIKKIRSCFAKQPKEFKSCHIAVLMDRDPTDKLCQTLQATTLGSLAFPLSVQAGTSVTPTVTPEPSHQHTPAPHSPAQALTPILSAPPPSPISPACYSPNPSALASPHYPLIFEVCHTSLHKKFPDEETCREVFPSASVTSIRTLVGHLVTFSTLVDPRIYIAWGLDIATYLEDILRPRRPPKELLDRLVREVLTEARNPEQGASPGGTVTRFARPKAREYILLLLRFLNGQPLGLSRVNQSNLVTLQVAFPELYKGLLTKLVHCNVLLSMYLVKWKDHTPEQYLARVEEKFQNHRAAGDSIASVSKRHIAELGDSSPNPSSRSESRIGTVSWEDALNRLFDREAIKLAKNRLRILGLLTEEDAALPDDPRDIAKSKIKDECSAERLDDTQPIILTGKLRRNADETESVDPSAATESIRESADLLDSSHDAYLEDVHYQQRSQTDSESILDPLYMKAEGEDHNMQNPDESKSFITQPKSQKLDYSLYGEDVSSRILVPSVHGESNQTIPMNMDAIKAEESRDLEVKPKKDRLSSKKKKHKRKKDKKHGRNDQDTASKLSAQISENLERILTGDDLNQSKKVHVTTSMRNVPATSTKQGISHSRDRQIADDRSPPTTSTMLNQHFSPPSKDWTKSSTSMPHKPSSPVLQAGNLTPPPPSTVSEELQVGRVIAKQLSAKASKSSLQKARAPSEVNHRKPYQNPLLPHSTTSRSPVRAPEIKNLKPGSVSSRNSDPKASQSSKSPPIVGNLLAAISHLSKSASKK